MTTNQASQIAAKKNVPLHKDDVTMGVSDTMIMANPKDLNLAPVEETVQESIVESPLSYKSKKKVKKNKALELIKKYSA